MKMLRTALISAILSFGVAGSALADTTCGKASGSGSTVINNLTAALKKQALSNCNNAGKKSYTTTSWAYPTCSQSGSTWVCSGCMSYTCK